MMQHDDKTLYFAVFGLLFSSNQTSKVRKHCILQCLVCLFEAVKHQNLKKTL